MYQTDEQKAAMVRKRYLRDAQGHHAELLDLDRRYREDMEAVGLCGDDNPFASAAYQLEEMKV